MSKSKVNVEKQFLYPQQITENLMRQVYHEMEEGSKLDLVELGWRFNQNVSRDCSAFFNRLQIG